MPIELKRILQDDRLWVAMVALCRFTAPAMLLLRITDRKKPAMDKVKYFSSKMEQYMVKNADRINEIFVDPEDPSYEGSIWSAIETFLGMASADIHGDDEDLPNRMAPKDSPKDSDSSSLSESDGELEEDEEDRPAHRPVPNWLHDSFAGQVLNEWFERSPYLEHEYAITAWVCSPAEPIMAHAKENLTGPHRRMVEALLKKLLIQKKTTETEQRRETVRVINGFWTELKREANRIPPPGGANDTGTTENTYVIE